MDSDVNIASSTTLTIEPGVTVKLAPSVRITMDQGGNIHANGTTGNKIHFTQEQIQEIVSYETSLNNLASKFNVSRNVIKRIRREYKFNNTNI